MRRVLASACAVAALVAVPTAASAINVSSNDGSGFANSLRWYNTGVQMGGSLKSTNGNAVYFSANLIYDGELDYLFGRYTTDTTSLSLVTRGGLAGFNTGSSNPAVDGIKVRVCRNKSNLPDSCGSWSAQDRR